MAAVGAGGVAAAAEPSGRPSAPVPFSVPDAAADDVADQKPAQQPVTGPTSPGRQTVFADAGESLRNRILAQARSQRSSAGQSARDAGREVVGESARGAEHFAAPRPAGNADHSSAGHPTRDAGEQAAGEQAAKEAAARKVREEAARKKAAEEARRQEAMAAGAREVAHRYVKPVASATLTAGFGEASSLWSAVHIGQDFTAPTGTPVLAIHGGTIISAGWAGPYGYRIVLTLDDGTQVWYCHLSSMVKTSGPVSTGEVIGRVGATGNVTGPHLHLEVRPDGGAPVDPMGWLRDHDVAAPPR